MGSQPKKSDTDATNSAKTADATKAEADEKEEKGKTEKDAGAPEPQKVAKWECPSCGELNKVDRTKCNSCGKEKPEGVTIIAPDEAADAEKDDEARFREVPDDFADLEVIPEKAPVHDPDADWECKGCGDMNRPDALRCITCNMDAPKATTVATN